MNYFLNLLFTAIFTICCNYTAYCQAGSNDPAFNPSDLGYSIGDGANSLVRSVRLSDGKIAILGNFTTYNGISCPRMARLNPDGSFDPTFNPGTGVNNSINEVCKQPDEKIIITGLFTTVNGVSKNGLARINQDGSLDASFDAGTGFGSGSVIYSIAVQTDGKILIAGSFSSYNGASTGRLIRLNSDGSLDLTFIMDTGSPLAFIESVILQPDNKILIGGTFSSYSGTSRKNIARLNSDGTVDTSFDPGVGPNSFVSYLLLQTDGKIIVFGNFSTFNGLPIKRIIRLNSNGTHDSSFNSGSGFPLGAFDIALMQADGKIVIGGALSTYNGTAIGDVLRINPDGTLDTSFYGPSLSTSIARIDLASNGKIIVSGGFTNLLDPLYSVGRIMQLNSDGSFDLTFNPGHGANDAVRCTVLQPDGKIFIGGVFTGYNGNYHTYFARLLPDGNIDPAFPYTNGSPDADVISMKLQPDGKIIIGGGFLNCWTQPRSRIARILSDGTLDLSFNPGTGANNIVVSTDLQSDGNILIGGFFTTYNGLSSKYLARLTSAGALDASFNIGTGADNAVYATPIQSDGKIIVCGVFTTFNGIPSNRIVRLNANGSIDPTFDIGTGSSGSIYCAKIQPDGKIIIAGQFSSFNGVARKNIARLNSDGSLDLSFDPGTGANNNINTLNLQADGKLIIGGQFSYINGVSRNAIARLNVDGSLDMSFNPGSGVLSGGIWGSAIQPDGNIVIVGGFTSYNGVGRNRVARVLNNCPVTFFNSVVTNISCYGENNGSINLTAIGGTAPFSFTWNDGNTSQNRTNLSPGVYQVTIIDANGCQTSLNEVIGEPAQIFGTDIQTACDSLTWIDGNTYYVSTNTPTFVLQNTAGCDSTVTLNLTITNSTTGTDVQTTCDSLTWIDGNTYYVSTNTPTFVLQNAAGCDSTVTLNLTIANSTTGTDVQTACDSLTWIDGNTYYVSTNTPTFVLQNAAGCDSTVTLNLTIANSTTGTDVQTACDSLTWIDGNTYYASTNTPTFVLQNAAGCDSTVTLNLTITNSTTGTDVQTACDSLTWIDGNTYYASTNTPTFVLQNAAGCDSTVTLNLTITNSTTGTDVQTACDSLTWIDGNTYYASTNTPTFVLQNAAGCDSTVTLNLTITNSTTGTDVQTACDSLIWIDGNTYYASTNTPTFVLQNAAGCDSTVTLNLTVLPISTSNTVISECESYTWTNNITYTSSGVYTDTLTNSNGCDSIATLNLTILQVAETTEQVTHCGPFLWPLNGQTYGFSGFYTDTVQSANGCDSIVHLNIHINSIPSSNVIDNGNGTFTSSYSGIWEWIDCNTNVIVAGGQTFSPTQNGNYALIVTDGVTSCEDTSDCFLVDYLGIAATEQVQWAIYPNPTTDQVHISFSGSEAELTVYDLQGKVVLKDKIQNNGTVSLQNFERGVYLFDFKNSQGHNVQRIVKQ